MRIDLYTKTILTLIAVLLAVIALKPIIQTDAGASTSEYEWRPVLCEQQRYLLL